MAKGTKGKNSSDKGGGSSGSLGSENFFLSNILDTDTTHTTDGESSGLHSGQEVEDVETGVKSGGTIGGSQQGSNQKNWLPIAKNENMLQKRLRQDFVSEMRHLSKLRQ